MKFFSKQKGVKKSKNRIWEVDFFRFLCILYVVFDHIMFDFSYLPYWTSNFYFMGKTPIYYISEFANIFWTHPIRIAVRIAVVFLLVALSGISSSLTRNNNRRLAKLAIASGLISLVTILADLILNMGISIYFGILHILSLSLLIYILLDKLKNKYVLLIAGVAIVIAGAIIDFSSTPYYYAFTWERFFSSIIGLCSLGSDSYGIFPYTGIFLIGAFLGKLVYADKTSLMPSLNVALLKPFNIIGRNTMIIYLLHQPVILGIVMLIALMCGYTV